MRGSGLEEEKFDEYPHEQITNEDIEKMGIPWYFLDEINKMFNKDQKTALVNLDYSGKPGTHWAVLLTNPNTKTIYFFDPLGYENDGTYDLSNNEFEKKHHIPEELVKASREHGYKIFYVNKNRIQYKKSWMCGYYALKLAKTILDNPTMLARATRSPADFELVIKQLFGSKPSPSNVGGTINWWSKQ